MLCTLLLATASLMQVSTTNVLSGLNPQTDSWSVKFTRADQATEEAMFERADRATLLVETATHSNRAAVEKRFADFRGSMAVGIRSAEERKKAFAAPSGNPLGDILYNSEDPDSHSMLLMVGAENVMVTVTLNYFGSIEAGVPTWQVGNLKEDRILVEDLARRTIGRLLSRRINTSLYKPVSQWATKLGSKTTASRSVSAEFNLRERRVLVLTGANKVKVGENWVSLGEFVIEVNGQPNVSEKALARALQRL